MSKTKNAPKVVRTSAGLRDAIFDELDSLREGTSNPTRANAVAKLSASIVETVRMEIDAERLMRRAQTGAQLPDVGIRPLALGS